MPYTFSKFRTVLDKIDFVNHLFWNVEFQVQIFMQITLERIYTRNV